MTTTVLAGRVHTMTERGVLDDHAITVEGGRITAIRPRDGVAGEVLDWRHLDVLPGLTDSHAHVMNRADMLLNLAHGVTLLRNMWGTPWHLLWQQRVSSGLEPGPFVVTTSPLADGPGPAGTTMWPGTVSLETYEDAHDTVLHWARLGYQQVKAYNWLNADALRGLADGCREGGIPLVGHCAQAFTVQQVADLGQTCFEHLTNYEYGTLRAGRREELDARLAGGAGRWDLEVQELRSDIDPARLRDLASQLSDLDVTSVPTLLVLDRMFGVNDPEDPRLAYVDRATAASWQPENHFLLRALSEEQRSQVRQATQRRLETVVSALRDAGARVLVGTDAPNPYLFQGHSVVEEMQRLVDVGYTTHEVLHAATAAAADYLGLPDRGRLDVGARADLIAVTGDPRDSVLHLRDPEAVVASGTVLDRAALDRLLDEARGLLHDDLAREQPSPADETEQQLVRTQHGVPAGSVRVSCCTPRPGLTQWRERLLDRTLSSTSTVVIDAAGVLQSARVERSRYGSTETAVVDRTAEGYDVTVTTLDGAVLTRRIEGEVAPGVDLGVHAFLDATARGAGRALALDIAFDAQVIGAPVDVQRDADATWQCGRDQRIRVSRGPDDVIGVTGTTDQFVLRP